ncbi:MULTISPECIES: hypothetical protein [unclassified Bradyrhizobium]|uniref:hypothetical protein n=1 Tax=unclassified Bradyrhizobium TaxID=2631580 RepID=UPI0028EA0E71|nr:MULTISPECIES: hypothetical protein [unclassified Bradyrhizobium]
MDPTMGETTFDVYESASTLANETAVVTTASPATAPETSYPVGAVDFNKPFEVFDSNDDDDRHSNARVLAVLAGNNYPVVVVSNDGSEEVVTQFDTDGNSLNGDLSVENVGPAVEQIKFVIIFKDRRDFSLGAELYDTEQAAFDVARNESDVFAVLPVTIPALKQEIPPVQVAATSDDDEEDEGEAVDAGPKYVAGMTLKTGDKVRAYRKNRGSRTCTILKTRHYPAHKQLYIQADGENPYWALNKNISRNW